jgi:hypothetical protein
VEKFGSDDVRPDFGCNGAGNCGWQGQQQMKVVCNPADPSGRDTVLFGNSTQEWPEPFPQLRVQHRDTLFGAENTMNIERAKGVGHGRLYSGISLTKTYLNYVLTACV